VNVELLTLTLVVGWLAASVRLAIPILFAALGELFTERAGILNLGLEGIMLMGALSSFLVAFITGSLWLGLLAGALSGMAMSLLMAFMSVTVKANQVVAGLGITILGGGLSTLFFRLYFGLRSTRPMIERAFSEQPIPFLSQIPVLGEVLFSHNILAYLALILVGVSWLILYRTGFGLALRAVGERPDAADVRGLNVAGLRYTGLLIGGALAGIGGAYLPLADFRVFWPQMTTGRGFIAVAVVIFARWDPIRVLAGSLLFGGAVALQITLQTLQVPISPELLLMLPYIITILVLVGISRRAEFPASFTVPYSREKG
jgi:ABC-type uncharacterized transport system permease subunit